MATLQHFYCSMKVLCNTQPLTTKKTETNRKQRSFFIRPKYNRQESTSLRKIILSGMYRQDVG